MWIDGFCFVQWIWIRTKIDGLVPSSTGPSSRQGGCLKELCQVHQLPPYSEVVQFKDDHGNMESLFFFSFLFFFSDYGTWGSAPLYLLLSGSVACDMDVSCPDQLRGSWFRWNFSAFPLFLRRPFLNPLFSSSHFFIFLLLLLLWFLSSFCTYSFDFSVSPISQVRPFLYTPFFKVLFASFLYASFPFRALFFLFLDGRLFWY